MSDINYLVEMSLKALSTRISPSIKNTQFHRKETLGREFNLSNIISIDLKPPNVMFTWHVTPTFAKVVNVVDPHLHQFKAKKDKKYELQVLILDFYKLKKNKKLKQLTVDDLTRIINLADVKVWSSSPSFHYQGFNYRLSKIKSSIYPTTIPDTKWRETHKNALIDKHLYLVFKDVKDWIPQMAIGLKAEIKRLEG